MTDHILNGPFGSAHIAKTGPYEPSCPINVDSKLLDFGTKLNPAQGPANLRLPQECTK